MPVRLAALALCGLILAGCASTPGESELEALYLAAQDDGGGGSPAEQARAEARRAERIDRVLELLATASAPEGDDLLFAAAVLLDSGELQNLTLAEDLALEAATRGDDRGFPLAAEAIDRQCLVLGQPQRYGTQYLYTAGRWSLYPTDPATTDTERRAMGVPTLAEAQALAAELPDPD